MGSESRAADDLAASAIGELVAEQLAEERVNKTSLEARGLALITTSGAFTTLVLGIAALVGDGSLPGASRMLLVLSLLAFVVAATMGVVVNMPANYDEPRAASLKMTLKEHAGDDLLTGVRAVNNSRIDVLDTARSNNQTKACRLLIGAWAQVVAMFLVAGAGVVALAF